jgi:hypothetical protein
LPEAFCSSCIDNNLWWWNRSFGSRWKIPFRYIFVWSYNYWQTGMIIILYFIELSTSSNFTTGTQKCVGNSNESIKSILSCDLIT